MYLPPHFAETRSAVLHDLIARHPFGTLVSHSAAGLDANHIPFELMSQSGTCGSLRAHIARDNPLWKEVAQDAEVLVIFRAADAYVSPNWYPTKDETGRQVPTWNYRIAHVHGRIRFHDDEKFVRSLVARLTRIHESSQATPWKMADAPQDYIDELITRIIGVEITIERIVGKSKLGQDEVERDIRGVGAALLQHGSGAIGQAMLDQLDQT